MTPEEAGQRILEGHPWVPCNNCKGNGHVWRPVSVLSTELEKRTCTRCRGLAWMVEKNYAEAVKVLGLPWPGQPSDKELYFMSMSEVQRKVLRRAREDLSKIENSLEDKDDEQ